MGLLFDKAKFIVVTSFLTSVGIYVHFHSNLMREYSLKIKRELNNISKEDISSTSGSKPDLYQPNANYRRKSQQDTRSSISSDESPSYLQTTDRYDINADKKEVAGHNIKNLPIPECEDILGNMTQGRWVKKVHLPQYKSEITKWTVMESRLEAELSNFWVKRGIQTAFWREDFRCGYFNYENQPRNTPWPKVGSWCNAKGDKPCCSDIYNGMCMKPSKKSCNCPRCVDMRKFIYADVSDWIVTDKKCRWRKYSALEACEVIENSPISDIYFIGDSFVRNMFRTFAMLITDDYDQGAMNSSTPMHERNLCTQMQQYFWKECRETLNDVSKTLHRHKLCGGRGHANFSAKLLPYYNLKFSQQFLDLVKSKIGVTGTLIIVSIGFHMGCESKREIEKYLGPAVDAIAEWYGDLPDSIIPTKLSGRWPQIILSLPLSIGLLKPSNYLRLQNEAKCGKYSSEMIKYAAEHDIRVLDFRKLTKMVHSFDGTHHGINVNILKNQILLNFLSLLNPL